MNERTKNTPDSPLRQSSDDTQSIDLAGMDDDYYAAYAEWAAQEPEVVLELPHDLYLDEDARKQKLQLDDRMMVLLARLKSEEVQARGHYNPGGEAEVVTDMRSLQAEELPRIYANVKYESDYLPRHTCQVTDDWCQLACVQNAFRALGDESVTQDMIAKILRIHPKARPFPEQMMDFARSRGLAAQTVDSVTDMIDRITAGGKTILSIGYLVTPIQHAVLVSGVRIDRGKIEFLCNDSAQDEGAQAVSLERMLQFLEPPLAHNKLNRSFSLSNEDS